MRVATVMLVALLVAISASAFSVDKKKNLGGPGYYPKAWVDLFQPPYSDFAPEIMMSIGCTAVDSCYVPGGSQGSGNNAGFATYHFNGLWDGNFTLVPNDNVPKINFLMQVGVGGTSEAPKGAIGGAALLFGLQYFVNASYTSSALTTPWTETMMIKTDASGEKILFIDGMDTAMSLMYSTDAGETYSTITIPAGSLGINNTQCTLGVAQAIAADGVWMVAAGSSPDENKKGSGSSGSDDSSSSSSFPSEGRARDKDLYHVNNHVAMVRPGANMDNVRARGYTEGAKKNGRVRKSPRQEHLDWVAAGEKKPKCGYSAHMLMTSDSGKTWTSYNFNTTTWSPADVDCIDTNNCIMVGSGNLKNPGAYVYVTADGGQSWNRTLHLLSDPGVQFYMLSTVRHNPANPQEIWVGGGFENAMGQSFGIFYESKDGGSTWTLHGQLDYVAEVLQIDFTPSGDAFAVGITIFQDSTIMRYTHNGPTPTPAPAWTGNFTQIQCDDEDCSVNCQAYSFPQNTCLNLTNGGSAMAQCDMTNDVLIQDMYPLDQTCWGPAAAQPTPLGICFYSSNTSSFKTICGPPPPGMDVREADLSMLKTVPKKN